MIETKTPKWKIAFAVLGAGFLVAGAVLAVSAAVNRPARGPSPLTLYPEKQEEILAERSALELQKRLNLREEQIPAVTAVFMEIRALVRAKREGGAGNVRNLLQLREEMIQELDERLTPLLDEEQRALYDRNKENLMGRMGQLRALRQRFLGGSQDEGR